MATEEDFEDDEFSAQSEDEESEEDPVEDDEMTAGEEGFLRGYNEEADTDEAEEEELWADKDISFFYRYSYLCQSNC